MRLQLTVALMISLSTTTCASAPTAKTRAGYRQFRDARVNVSSPRVDASVGLGESTTVSPYWTADVITAATPTLAAPDAVTRATEYTETRHEAGIGGSTELAESVDLSGNYTLSSEPDFVSHTAGLAVSHELFSKMSTASVGVRVSGNEVGSTRLPEFSEQMWAGVLDLGWTQVLTAELLAKVSFTGEQRSGYQANPYRYVGVFGNDPLRAELVIPEALPDRRLRGASDLLVVWSMTPSLFLRGSYRFYIDDWRLISHAVQAESWWEGLDGHMRIRARLRGYDQSATSFYSARYTNETRYRTGDYRFSPMSTVSMGARIDGRILEASFADVLELSLGYDAMLFRFWDYELLDSMMAHMFSVALSAEL